MNRYTKADLERIVFTQLENLNAMHDLLIIMKTQTELISTINTKLKEHFSGTQPKPYARPSKRRVDSKKEGDLLS